MQASLPLKKQFIRMKKITLFSLLLGIVFSGCKTDFLDRQIATDLTEEQVFSSYDRTREFLNNIYNHVPNGFDRVGGSLLAAATDDAEFNRESAAIQNFNTGSWSPTYNPEDSWSDLYAGIQKCNRFLDKTQDVNYEHLRLNDPQRFKTQTENLAKFRLEARTLRAFFYFELIKRYGGVPLITETLELEDDLNMARNSFEECVDFIVREIATILDPDIPAALALPVNWSGAEEGRIDRGTALALKSRLLLYAASPLHNPSNDITKWIQAAEASIAVYDMNKYNTLHNNYQNLFRSVKQQEIIFARRMSPSNSFEKENYPVGYEGGQTGTTPTENLVSAYEMLDGSSFDWDNPEHAANPYENRDPRLLMTVVVNNSMWNGRPVESWAGGRDGLGIERATETGYYLKKHVAENLDLFQGNTASHTWILFRMAEIYLNYAEAMNEAYGPDQDPDGFGMTAIEAINKVRNRGGVNMPLLEAGQWTQDSFRDKVRHERRIELAFEEHRYWDVRRWGLVELFNSPVYGVHITKNTGSTFTYEPFALEPRIFSEKMLLYPIPFSETVKSPKLDQNPGW